MERRSSTARSVASVSSFADPIQMFLQKVAHRLCAIPFVWAFSSRP